MNKQINSGDMKITITPYKEYAISFDSMNKPPVVQYLQNTLQLNFSKSILSATFMKTHQQRFYYNLKPYDVDNNLSSWINKNDRSFIQTAK